MTFGTWVLTGEFRLGSEQCVETGADRVASSGEIRNWDMARWTTRMGIFLLWRTDHDRAWRSWRAGILKEETPGGRVSVPCAAARGCQGQWGQLLLLWGGQCCPARVTTVLEVEAEVHQVPPTVNLLPPSFPLKCVVCLVNSW